MVDYALRTQVEAIKARHDQEAALVVAEHTRAAQTELDALIPPKGTRITAADAAEKYGIGVNTPARWAERGLIEVIEEGRPGRGGAAVYDEHDIARIALPHDIRQGRRTDRMKGLKE